MSQSFWITLYILFPFMTVAHLTKSQTLQINSYLRSLNILNMRNGYYRHIGGSFPFSQLWFWYSHGSEAKYLTIRISAWGLYNFSPTNDLMCIHSSYDRHFIRYHISECLYKLYALNFDRGHPVVLIMTIKLYIK